MRRFTRDEIRACNGKNGSPVYLVYQGKVYDVSGSFLWKTGRHQVLHEAGSDLTGDLETAPHGPEMLDRFPVLGILDREE
jgi:predicted heme/steroid binding protein